MRCSFKPNGVSADQKAPAIVVSHGWWNNKEMQDANYVELARRGYVVLSIDMYGHGDSDYLTSDITLGGTGMYDGVKLLAALPYVDTSKIGVSGHSNGARAANFSVALDNAADKPLIAGVFLVDNDPVYTDAANDNAYFDLYGTRDTGLVADQYDEFFFRSYSAEGAVLTPPREYIDTPNAQSFLHYGEKEAALVFPAKVLQQPPAGADADLHRHLLNYVQQLDAPSDATSSTRCVVYYVRWCSITKALQNSSRNCSRSTAAH